MSTTTTSYFLVLRANILSVVDRVEHLRSEIHIKTLWDHYIADASAYNCRSFPCMEAIK